VGTDPVRRARRELELKGTEYLAELDENYLMSDDPEKEFAPEDLALIRWFISLKDPNFDQRAARARHFETLREMQQLREDWQQAEAQVAQEEIAARVARPARAVRRTGLFPAAPVGPDERQSQETSRQKTPRRGRQGRGPHFPCRSRPGPEALGYHEGPARLGR